MPTGARLPRSIAAYGTADPQTYAHGPQVRKQWTKGIILNQIKVIIPARGSDARGTLTALSAFRPPAALGASAALVPGFVGERCATGQEGVPKGTVTRALIKDIVSKSLSEMGDECPESELDKFVRTATPVVSRAATPASKSSRSYSLIKRKNGKRSASSSSEEETTGSDSESESTSSATSGTGRSTGSRSDSSLVEGKKQKGH
ncbi:hypothetical protein EVAR_53514_1 [Eumeta japonica]|uniref:Uncharacterized protein n=1 Tax=Eumeta variegata TaxID=151549 RepID=A0A4C1Y5S4_EUMVA|nr:hypothetical protein EVAR_53514_1 [Eumeta japonica]